MRCPRCDADNAEGRRYCGSCGVPLPRACVRCGSLNQATDRFCGACGSALGTEAPTADPVAERRHVTVMFADLAGYTTLSRMLDAEDLRELVARVLAVIDEAVEAHGGTVDKHMGDATMALFGAPVAHDDDPLRAVESAAVIHDRFAELARQSGRVLQVHIGIASGEVVAGGIGRGGAAGYTVIGESVNLAARLTELARAGETLISAEVRDRVAERVACVKAGVFAVRGLDRSIVVWRLARDQAADAAPWSPPFVGRRAELAQISGLLDGTRHGGHVMVVRGEAGIGKTRLVEQVSLEARGRGFGCHRVLVLDFGVGKGQDAVRALVRSLAGLAPASAKGERDEAAAALMARGWLGDEHRLALDDLLDLPMAPSGRRLFEAMDNDARAAARRAVLGHLIRGAAAVEPRLIVVEDVHWADRSTLADLGALAGTLARVPAVLLMTTRIEGDPVDRAWRGAAGATPVTTIDLGPLRPDEAADLAQAFPDPGAELVAHCIARAEGNPLFLVQLLRHAADALAGQIPGSIQSLVLARVDRLAAGDRRALQAAAVIGQRFGIDAVRHLIDDPGYDPAALVDQGLVRPDGPAYLFGHALIRDGVYGSLVKTRRRDLHARAAAWFAERQPALRAEHLARAEDPEAPRALLDAARTEARALRTERALALGQTGLALATDPADRSALASLIGDIHRDLGQGGSALAAFEQALADAADDEARCHALIGLADAKRMTDDVAGAFAVLDQAEPMAERLGLAGALAAIHTLRGNLHFPLGQIEACKAAHTRAVAAARAAASPEAEARALGGLSDAAYAEGRMTTARRHLEACLALARDHGLVRVEAAYRPMLSIALLYALDIRAAVEEAHAALALARRIGHRRAEVVGLHAAFFAEFSAGDHASCRQRMADALRLARELGAPRFEAEALAFQGILAITEGRRAEALGLVEAALAIARGSGLAYWGPIILALLAYLSPDPAVQGAALAEGRALLAAGSISHNHFFFRQWSIDRALEAGLWAEAEAEAESLAHYIAGEPSPWMEFVVARARALARWGRGERTPAVRAELERLRTITARAFLGPGTVEVERALGAAEPFDRK